MFKSFFLSREHAKFAYFGALLIIASIAAQTYLSVALNSWYEGFYDTLQNAALPAADAKKSTADDFFAAMGDFALIAAAYTLIASLTAYFARVYCFAWRRAMTFAYLARWRRSEQAIEGASQRIQEDCYNFAKLTEQLGISVLRALLTLIAFLPILYTAAAGLAVPLFSSQYALIYWAVLASLGGLAISWIVGAKLPGLEYANQRAEAAFRKELVLAEDSPTHGAPATLFELFTGLRLNYRRLFLHYGYFDVWLHCYEQFMVIFAFLLVGANLFSGAISLGALMVIDNAFGQVRGAFSVLTTNWTLITELRSIHKRLREFERLVGL